MNYSVSPENTSKKTEIEFMGEMYRLSPPQTAPNGCCFALNTTLPDRLVSYLHSGFSADSITVDEMVAHARRFLQERAMELAKQKAKTPVISIHHITSGLLNNAGEFYYTADASDLGLRAGQWPALIETTLWNRQPLQLDQHNDDGSVDYRQIGGCITVRIFND